MNKRNYRVVFNGSISHSKGPWKSHKYLRKEGSGSSAKYYYSVKGKNSNRKTGGDVTKYSDEELDEAYRDAIRREFDAKEEVDKSQAQLTRDFGANPPDFSKDGRAKWPYQRPMTDKEWNAITEHNNKVAAAQKITEEKDSYKNEKVRRKTKKSHGLHLFG